MPLREGQRTDQGDHQTGTERHKVRGGRIQMDEAIGAESAHVGGLPTHGFEWNLPPIASSVLATFRARTLSRG